MGGYGLRSERISLAEIQTWPPVGLTSGVTMTRRPGRHAATCPAKPVFLVIQSLFLTTNGEGYKIPFAGLAFPSTGQIQPVSGRFGAFLRVGMLPAPGGLSDNHA
jgi:hypothetical protein